MSRIIWILYRVLVSSSRIILIYRYHDAEIDWKEFATSAKDPRVSFLRCYSMRRKNQPGKWHRIRKLYFDIKADQNQMYIISGRAQAVLSAVVQSILEECLQDAENSARAAGKSCVTPEETEKALRKLCLRLNAQPSTPGKQKVNTQHEDA